MEKAAVIDIGSNSVRLLMIEDEKQEQLLETTRLGQGVQDRLLQPVPVQRTVEAVERFCMLARSRGIDSIFAFATSAVRDARNPEILLQEVARRTNLRIDVLPGDVEAQLAYLGAACGKRAGVVDIGGASTELVAGHGQVDSAISLQLGAVRLREQIGADRTAAQRLLDDAFATALPQFAPYQHDGWLGIGGTITTLAAMELEMEVYRPQRIDGLELHSKRVLAWVDKLWDQPSDLRIYKGLEPQRADIIAHGALILQRFMAVHGHAAITVSTSDNLMGYLALKKTGAR